MGAAGFLAEAARYFFHLKHMWPADQYELLLASNFRKFLAPGDAVIDIGAHVGRHAIACADIVGPTGRVLAFEPLPDIRAQLAENAKDRPWLSVRGVALGDSVGQVGFTRANAVPGESGLLPRVAFNVPEPRLETIHVESNRLDYLLPELDRLDYIKIDTEGAELLILRNGLDLLQKFRPVISAEYGSLTFAPYGVQSADLFDFAREVSFTPVDLFATPIVSRSEWIRIVDRAYWDYFLVPDEKLGWFLNCIGSD